MADKLTIEILAKNLTGRAFQSVLGGLQRIATGVKSFAVSSFRNIKRLTTASIVGFAAMVKGAADFRNQMALVNTMVSKGDIKKFTKDIINLSGELGATKKELSEGLYNVLSAGIPEDNAIDFLRTSAQAAVGGATDVGTSVKALTKVMEAYGAEAGGVKNVSDALFMSVKQGQITFEQLAQGVGSVAGIAASAEVSMDELLGVIAQASKTVNAERVFAGLRSTILAIQAPSEDLSEEFRKMGTSGQDMLKKQGLVGALREVEKMAGGSSDKLKKLIPTLESLPVVTALIGKNAKSAEDSINRMKMKAGEAATAFNKLDSVRAWPRLWQTIVGQVTKAGIKIDEKLQPAVEKISKSIRNWASSTQAENFFDKIGRKAQSVLDVVSDLFSPDSSTRQDAIDDIIFAGEDFAIRAVEVIKEKGAQIGEAIFDGFLKAIGNRARRKAQAKAELAAENPRVIDKTPAASRANPWAGATSTGGYTKSDLIKREAQIRSRTGTEQFTTTAGLNRDALMVLAEHIDALPPNIAEAVIAQTQ